MTSRDYRQRAREALKGNWGTAILVALVGALLGAGGSGGSSSGARTTINFSSDYVPGFYERIPPVVIGFFAGAAMLLALYGLVVFILGGAVDLGLKQYNISLIQRDQEPRFSLLFSKFDNFGKAFLLNLLMGLFTVLWTLLFIIPGIIAAYRYSMAPYIMAQNPDISAMDAIRQSKELMRGHKGELFVLHLSFIGWALLAALTFGLGFIVLNPYMHAAEAAFFLGLTGQLYGAYGTSAPGTNGPGTGAPGAPGSFTAPDFMQGGQQAEPSQNPQAPGSAQPGAKPDQNPDHYI